jgi:hypothetical protein
VPFIVCKIPEMSWRETVTTYGGRKGLRHEVTALFDEAVADGLTQEQAAFIALGEYDCLDYVEGNANE